MGRKKALTAEHRARRRDAHEKLAVIRTELREARARRKLALAEAKERCRAERLATRERTRALRLRLLRELRETGRVEREAARAACAGRRAKARSIKDDAMRARAKLFAEKQLQTDLRRLERAGRTRHASAPACVACRSETDDEVLANIPSDLAALFERVKRSIKGSTRVSRSEAFLKFAESRPDEVLVASRDVADERVRELERYEREAAKEARRKQAPHEARETARFERMRVRAERLAGAEESARASARRVADLIPMGQPISAGHSEKRHRRDLGRIEAGFSTAAVLRGGAEVLHQRADRAERSDAVSSDDPKAIPKLRRRVEPLDADRAVHPERAANQNALTAGGPLLAELERIRALEDRPKPAVKGAGLDTPQIAARIREDIKAAVRAGELPTGKYSVRTAKYSMGSSIDVVASRLPFPVLNPDAFFVEPGASWLTFDRARYQSRFTPAAQGVERKLSAIVDAYHWDRSDPVTDYHNERFARDVKVEEDEGAWRQLEAAKIAEARAAHARGVTS